MSMLGACVGDAAGAAVEGIRGRRPTQAEVDAALKMPGGGVNRVGPGQITDDGELTLALWSALYKWKPKNGYPVDKVLEAYAAWWASQPFDCGLTCSQAFEAAYRLFQSSIPSIEAYRDYVNRVNGYSEANGSLMRATAIVHWATVDNDIPAAVIALMGRVDAQLSHPNPVCQEANALYCYAAAQLLRRMGPLEVYKSTCDHATATCGNETVMRWLLNDTDDIEALDCRHNEGHVRYGFTLAFYFLRHPEINYEESIRLTLLKGGDTDTNAAIVGGLVGCYSEPPEEMRKPVMTFRANGSVNSCQMGSHVRPEWLWPWTYFS
jgi:ADP-ribosylglycohydrolase